MERRDGDAVAHRHPVKLGVNVKGAGGRFIRRGVEALAPGLDGVVLPLRPTSEPSIEWPRKV